MSFSTAYHCPWHWRFLEVTKNFKFYGASEIGNGAVNTSCQMAMSGGFSIGGPGSPLEGFKRWISSTMVVATRVLGTSQAFAVPRFF